MKIWRPVVGFEDRFSVSPEGEIRRNRDGYILRPHPVVGGYLRVTMSLNGRARNILVHRIVMEAFVGPCPEGHEVDHEDGDPANNALSNLSYMTPSQNVRAAFDRGHRSPAHGEAHASARLNDSLVMTLRSMAAAGASCAWLARSLGFSDPSIVQRAVNNTTWRHLPCP